MKCPVCKSETLVLVDLADNLPANQCTNCRGIWVSSNQYLAWVRLQSAPLPEKPITTPIDPKWDTHTLKLCPEDGHIMARYKIFPNLNFYLDRCRHCNGIWFDNYEWDVLVSHNMQDKVNQFFTKPWQEKMRAQEISERMDQIYLDKFGAGDYNKIKEIRSWLKSKPQQSMLLAYLQADDPYKI